MGFVRKTPAGTFRACWREPSGEQKSKSFRTKKEANAYLADVEGALNKGTYVDPHAGKARLGDFAKKWTQSRTVEARTVERTASIMRTHVLPKWEKWPLGEIDYMNVQEWVSRLARTLAPGTVAKCHGVLLMILRAAVRARLIAINPADGVQIPRDRKTDVRPATISRADFAGALLPAVPANYRALVCVAAGAGLRWGECAGLAWGSVDLVQGSVRVVQVAVETPGAVTIRPYPKTRAGVRRVPLPPFVTRELRAQCGRLASEPASSALVFGGRTSSAPRRANFRKRIWLPSLVRAGLLGKVVQVEPHRYDGYWPDDLGVERSASFTTEREAIQHVALHAAGGLRFHDLRHSYATWLITEGVPVNVVQRVMGHEQASTTLNLYTHTPGDFADRVLSAFGPDASPLPFDLQEPEQDDDNDQSEPL